MVAWMEAASALPAMLKSSEESPDKPDAFPAEPKASGVRATARDVLD